MQDRIVEFPQRYLLVPVSGEDGQYDLYPVTGTVTTAGTPLTKANLLTDATAALLGLAGDPTIDDAFNALTAKANIQIKSYTGNGTKGIGNENSITFDFAPKLFVISSDVGGYSGSAFPWVAGASSFDVIYSNTRYNCPVTVSDNTVSWYNTIDAGAQMNYNGVTYYVLAIG